MKFLSTSLLVVYCLFATDSAQAIELVKAAEAIKTKESHVANAKTTKKTKTHHHTHKKHHHKSHKKADKELVQENNQENASKVAEKAEAKQIT